MSAYETFRSLHQGPEAFVMPNAWDGASAVLLKRAGFRALGSTSLAIAFGLGRQDGRHAVSLDEAVANASLLADVSQLPVNGDLEDGFGPEPDGITVLPDGGLLAIETGGWELLASGGHSWCRVRTPTPSPRHTYQLSAATVIGSQLWWLTGSLTSDSSATVNEVPLTALSC